MSLPASGTIARWARRGGWTIADQVLFAGTSFVAMVLLARWLEPAAYGALATAFAAFLLLGTAHTALWTEPMLVLGPDRFRTAFSAYRRKLMCGHWLASVPLAAAVALVASIFGALGEHELASASWGLAIAAPLILFMWLARRMPYVHLRPRLAVEGGALYLGLFLPLAWLTIRWGWDSAGPVLATMGVTAAAAGLWVAVRAGRHTAAAGAPVTWSEVAGAHWGYGRWALLAGLLSWPPMWIPFLLLPAVAGLEASAEFRAAMNLVLPAFNLSVVVNILLVPAVVAAPEKLEDGRILGILVSSFLAITIAWLVLILLAGPFVYSAIYGDRYGFDFGLLLLVGLLPPAQAAGFVFGAALRARQQPERIAAANAAVALVAVTVSVPSILLYGTTGAAVAMLVSSLASSAAQFAAWHWIPAARHSREVAE